MPKKLFTKIDSTFEVLYEWETPERYWIKREKAWFVTFSLFFLVIIFILAILSEFMLIMAVIAFAFLWFVQAVRPPEVMDIQITSIGVKAYDKLYKWKDIKHYWFSHNAGITYLNLEVINKKLSQTKTQSLSLICSNEDFEKIFFVLIPHVDYGDKTEIGFNIFARFTRGRYIDISYFLPDETPSQEEYVKEKKKI